MRIGFDCDDVLVDFIQGLCEYSNSRLETSLAKKDILHYNHLSHYFPVNDFHRFLYEYYESQEFSSLSPVKDAIDVLNGLKERGDSMYLITARASRFASKPTESFLSKHFSGIFDEVVFVYTEFGTDPIERKSSAARRIGIDFFVDDSLNVARELETTGSDFRLFDQPWNQKYEFRPQPPVYKRVYSFKDIANQLDIV